MSDHTERAKTIASNREVVPKPYGPSRWANPRRYACAHSDRPHAAKTLVPSGMHPVDETGSDRAHNCCGNHTEILETN